MRLQNIREVEIETQEFRGCRDRDSSGFKNLEVVEMETHRESKFETETNYGSRKD